MLCCTHFVHLGCTGKRIYRKRPVVTQGTADSKKNGQHKKNASTHVGKRVILKLDIRHFFDNSKSRHILSYGATTCVAPISEIRMSMIENTFRTAKNMFGEYGTAAFSKIVYDENGAATRISTWRRYRRMQKGTNQTMIPRNAAAQCATCKKHIPFTVTCKVHPKGIPLEIKTGKATCKECEKK